MHTRPAFLLRAGVCMVALALLAACASQAPRTTATQEAARYMANARHNYVPPGPPDDPWGPYIREAAARFDVPALWLRAVMHVESDGKQYFGGQLTTSQVGAMGLMQVMPGTYDELRQRYNLGSDPYDPYNNIMAGAAYMREMYDIYGSPGFLAAYNAGPYRLDDYLANNRPLPDETRRYVAMIGPEIVGVEPDRRSPAEQYAMNALPIDIPPGNRYGGVQFASRGGGGGRVPAPRPVQVAMLPTPPRPAPYAAPQQYALVAPPPPPPSRGFHIIERANAEPAPIWRGGPQTGDWGIQVGAYDKEGLARVAVGIARNQARVQLAAAHGAVISVRTAHGVLWRARLTGVSRETAVEACGRLSHSHTGCIVLSPQSQM
ncbi:MAG TPA: lytic transglycosylase domain-containing protein [Acetobacteraceae bacterium]